MISGPDTRAHVLTPPGAPAGSRVWLSPPHMETAERELLLDAYESNWIAPLGPHVDAFEHEFAAAVGMRHALAVSSGTAALHLALLEFGVGNRDEVFIPSHTFAASANAAVYCGAQPVFIDSHAATWTVDPDLVEEELRASAARGRLPRAVITVDLYGQCADYDRILDACARYGVPVIEDAAEALGATYRGRPAGGFGAAAAFSFNGNKIITTSGGGMLVSSRPDLIAHARYLSSQAREAVAHYEHTEIGYNYRMSNLLAAIGRGQLTTLAERVCCRRANNAFYRSALAEIPGITFMPEAGYGRPTCWLTCILIDAERFGASSEDLRLHLESRNIESRPVWKPMHLQPVFKDCRVRGGAVSARLFATGLCLPSGSNLQAAQRQRVVEGIVSLHESRRHVHPVNRRVPVIGADRPCSEASPALTPAG
jgi:dTDP-4-amino-4,6-dideoxygalactose transaminase